MFYRMRQFYEALTAKLTEEEQLFITKYLTKEEQALFKKLRVDSQKHSVKVAKLLKKEHMELMSKEQLIKLGLLHDIGKIYYPLNPVEKGIMVILNKLTKGKVKKLMQLKMVRAYYEHADLGYQLLKKSGKYSERFLQAVKEHHTVQPNDEITKLLKRIDDQC